MLMSMILIMLTDDVIVVFLMDVDRFGFCLRRFMPLEAGPFARWSGDRIHHRIGIGLRPSLFKRYLFSLDFFKVQKK